MSSHLEVTLPGISKSVIEFTDHFVGTPTFEALSKTTENNPWHDHQLVSDHVTLVFAKIQELLRLDWVSTPHDRDRFKVYLSQKRDQQSKVCRREQLLIACALHDVGKGSFRTLHDSIAPGQPFVLTNPDGTTHAPGHEYESARISRELLSEAVVSGWLSSTDVEHIVTLVARHDDFSFAWCQAHLVAIQSDKSRFFETVKARGQDYALELLLHITADEWGITLTQDFRETTLKTIGSQFWL